MSPVIATVVLFAAAAAMHLLSILLHRTETRPLRS